MNIVDIGIFVIVILSILLGIKRGVIKSALKLVGFVAITILAYTFKGILASWLMGFMPFFNFGGIFEGVYAVNILLYEVLSFVVIFVLLYCVLNILIAIGGIIDKIAQKTIILALPDRILGGLIGFVEGAMIAFLGLFILSQIPNTQKIVFESHFGLAMLERTPVIRTVLSNSTLAAEEVYQLVDVYKDDEDKTDFNIAALQIMIKYKIVTPKEVEEIEESGKLGIKSVSFS